MTSQTRRWKRLIIKWTAPKGFAAVLLFVASALVLEYLIVYSFLSGGLTDEFTWAGTFQIPYVNWSFVLAVSPLLHILPLSVIIVLIASWTFLARHIAFVPHRIESARKTTAKRRQPQRRRFKSFRRFFKRASRSVQKAATALKNAFLRIPGFSKLSRRLFFAKTATRSALIVLLAFVSFALLAYSLAYPWWIHDAVVNLYSGNPSFLSFVTGIQSSLQTLGKTFEPVSNTLLAAAPGFRSSLQNLGASTQSLVDLDIIGKYLLVQNLAAWVCALIALVYGKYASASRYKKR